MAEEAGISVEGAALSPSTSSASFSTAREGDSTEEIEATEMPSSWTDTFWTMLSPFSSHVSRSSGDEDASTVVERRDCSSMDTTPKNDWEQFQEAVYIMTGDNQIPPWTKTTSYTEIPICRQSETWDCGE